MSQEKLYTPLKVAAKTNPNSLAGAITKTLQEGNNVVVTAIGSDSINQLNKAEIITNGFLSSTGKRLDIIPAFGAIEGDDKREITTLLHYLTLISM